MGAQTCMIRTITDPSSSLSLLCPYHVYHPFPVSIVQLSCCQAWPHTEFTGEVCDSIMSLSDYIRERLRITRTFLSSSLESHCFRFLCSTFLSICFHSVWFSHSLFVEIFLCFAVVVYWFLIIHIPMLVCVCVCMYVRVRASEVTLHV